jgi:nucleoside-diphosphate-sugar epimerase
MTAIQFHQAAVVGATGPTGRHLVRELLRRGVSVRAVSRSEGNLRRAFGEAKVKRTVADGLNAVALRRALAGCDIVFDCIGLPLEQIADYPGTARNIAAAISGSGARAVQISSYWAYLPLRQLPLSEKHPRTGGNRLMKIRREAEDILRGAGAAIANLPDFYGPEVHASSLQQVLMEAAAGKRINWIGSPETPREYIYVRDAMQAVISLASCKQAYGELWIIPGAGMISLTQIVEIAANHLGRTLKVRSAGPLMLRLISLFVKELREFLPMVPTYLQPISYDGTKLRRLLGNIPATPYAEGIPCTLDWLGKPNKDSS